jgi:DNA polymerase bacteriophage-type
MIKKAYIDFETYSPVDIGRTLANYAPQARVLMCSWALGNDPIKLWVPEEGEPMPVALHNAVQDPSVWIVAHNASFEHQVTAHTKIFGGVDIPLERFYCTMAQALEHNLPASLENLCEVFNLPEDKRKKREGQALIKWFCTPNEHGQFRGMEPADKWQRFKEYCIADTEAMRILHNKMPRINYPFDNDHMERKLWLETERMNQRGFGVDLDLAKASVAMAARLADESDSGMLEATGGVVKSPNQTAVLKQYILDTYGVALPDLQAATLERFVNDMSVPVGAREVILARMNSSKTSVAKYRKLIQCADSRSRMTSTIVFCGASGTGRDAGRTFQPQNLPRPKEWFDGDYAEQLISEIKDGTLDLLHSDPMSVMSSALRGSIIPAQGKKLVVSDESNIEGRMVAWLAGEDWKTQYFRDYDTGKIKFDNYVAAYSKSMGAKIEDVTKAQRQVGKCQELSLGYGSGVGGLLQFLEIYRVNVQELAAATQAVADTGVWYATTEKFDWAQKNGFDYGLPLHQWAACEYIKTQWRMAHKNIAQLWSDCETAFRQAYMTPDVWFFAGKHLAYKRKGSWIFCRLPSGRVLSYIQPKINEDGITYMTMNQMTHKWTRTKVYSGKFVAHATQASARDLLFQNMLKAKESGYDTVMRVHDELICEVPDDTKYSAEKLGKLIATPLPWCPDLPLAAAGYETNVRYKKD